MTDSQCREAFKPCRKCGSTDFDLWDGRGTQAEMECDCGNHESIQVSDYLTQEERLGNDPDFQWHGDRISYGEKAVTRAREQLAKEWNARAEPVPDEAMVERVARAIVGHDEGYNSLSEYARDLCKEKAKAAIAAMRGAKADSDITEGAMRKLQAEQVFCKSSDTLRAAAVQALEALKDIATETTVEVVRVGLFTTYNEIPTMGARTAKEAITALETALRE